ncbi:hypothetical protein ACHQM5_013832 [Ranunculus cassubicifolius]
MKNSNPIALGPWGSAGGSKWSFNEDGKGVIKQIIIRHGGAIDSIMFKVEQDRCEEKYTQRFGGGGGNKTTKVNIDWPAEYITSLRGHYGRFTPSSPIVIRSLAIITNVAEYGPIGPADGTSFIVPMENGVVTGFHGRSGEFLDSIGAYVKPYDSVFSSPKNATGACVAEIPEQLTGQTSLPRSGVRATGVGPWGGIGGMPFDDGVSEGIKQILVHRGEDVIYSIVIEYVRNGKSVWSRRHGGSGGHIINRIKFDYPDEHLISISGFYGAFKGHDVIKSLSFYTTKGGYGPFGEEAGVYFTSAELPAKVVGFHGRCGVYLDALGVVRYYFD